MRKGFAVVAGEATYLFVHRFHNTKQNFIKDNRKVNVGAVNSKLLVNSLYCALQKIFILNIYFHLLKISKALGTDHV